MYTLPVLTAEATVGALRTKATHVDTSLQRMGGGRQPELDPELKVLTMGALANLQKQMDSGLEEDETFENQAIAVKVKKRRIADATVRCSIGRRFG